MHPGTLSNTAVGTGILLTSVVLLIGVLSLAYGVLQPSPLAFRAGLVVTGIGAVIGMIQVAVFPKR